MSERHAVEFALSLGEGTYLNVSRDLDSFGVRIGAWLVRLEGGNLTVREHEAALNAEPILKVPA